MFNIYEPKSKWFDTASYIEKVLVENEIHRMPCFIVGTKRGKDDSNMKPVVSTVDVLHYVDDSRIWESYMETDFGRYCNTMRSIDAQTAIEPVLRSLLRRESDQRKHLQVSWKPKCLQPRLTSD